LNEQQRQELPLQMIQIALNVPEDKLKKNMRSVLRTLSKGDKQIQYRKHKIAEKKLTLFSPKYNLAEKITECGKYIKKDNKLFNAKKPSIKKYSSSDSSSDSGSD
jgi:hypothetical protein